jgi:DNA repair exonuclease SbcCD ATPase subunit
VQQLEAERPRPIRTTRTSTAFKGTLQEIDFDEINRLTELLRHQDFLMKLLTNKDSFVRKKIIDQNLYYLNTRLAFYLEKLGLPHEVVFMNDLTTEITILGRDLDFEQLSRGEQNRVIMSVSWAFRDVWESLNHSVNLVWVDELIDNGLDSQGAEAALAVMKSFSRNRKNVFLISHRDELVGRIDRTLLVAKDNGFTTITEEVS